MVTSTDTQQTKDLRRPIEGRMIAGVAAGLGNRFSINPWWFRVGLILLTFAGGFGLALYAIGWLLIPEQGTDEPVLARWISGVDTSNKAMMIGIALIGLAALILATSIELVSGQILFAAALFVIGVLLYRGDIGRSSEPADPDDGGGVMPSDVLLDDVETTGVVATELDEPADGGSGPPEGTLPVPAAQPPPPVEPQPRSILGQLTFAAVLIAVGGLALLDVAGVLAPGFVHYMAVALGVVGGGLLVGTFFGRARGLIIVGLLLTPLLLLASVVPSWSLDAGAGDEFFRPVTVAEIEAQEYELAAGSLHLDLTDLPDPGAVRIPIDVRIGAGEIRIDVPSDVAVFVEGSVGIGAVDLFGDNRAGIGVSQTAETGPIPVYVISAEAGVGNIVVRER